MCHIKLVEGVTLCGWMINIPTYYHHSSWAHFPSERSSTKLHLEELLPIGVFFYLGKARNSIWITPDLSSKMEFKMKEPTLMPNQ